MRSLRSVDSRIVRIFTAFGSDKPYKVYCVTIWVIIVIIVTETKLTKDELQQKSEIRCDRISVQLTYIKAYTYVA
jgi:hypothetical protein